MLRFYSKEILKYADDETIFEVKINKPEEVITKDIFGNRKIYVDESLSLSYLKQFVTLLANAHDIDLESKNAVSLEFGTGNRVTIVGGKLSRHEFSMNLRLNRSKPIVFEEVIKDEALREELKQAVIAKKTILIAGSTGSGKTTLLNALVSQIPHNETILTLEGIPEIKCNHPDWCSIVYDEHSRSSSAAEALNEAMRLNPDRIIVGEIRKENAFILNRAIESAHEGSMATIHADSYESALRAVTQYAVINGNIDSTSQDSLYRILEEKIDMVVLAKRTDSSISYSIAKKKEMIDA
ncbi:MAG: Flp pilus assembly complex ATPase component TadA [Alphaproteobacteria bacterium]|nr:Flp pilus assembly complex ATPase component TadA [Alphaproteobacteria bacterium]